MTPPSTSGPISSGPDDGRTRRLGSVRSLQTHPPRPRWSVVCDELCRRWIADEPVSAETVLAAFPEVETDADAVLEVILTEVRLRRQRGQTPHPEDYHRRFPHLTPALERLWPTAAPLALEPLLGGVPGYEILSELGRGGMGVVYKGRHLKLDRLVAVKCVRVETADARERFRLETRAVAALHHPGIVQIFEVGEYRGQPYYAMEYVPGGSLADRMTRPEDPPAWRQDRRAAARLVEQLARAVHHAHTRGIVHRDLKPSNVLLTADGAPCVADFGLVKWLDDEPERAGKTETGVILGTPCYMAPEQAKGRTAAVGPAADVYALGAILYHLLADRPPFAAGSSLESLILAHSTEPIAPSYLIPSCPRDLETICLKCLEKDPDRRYGSAGELADDLNRFLAGLPVHARPLSVLGRTLKWARRHPAVAALSVAVAVSLAVCFVLFAVWLRAAELANGRLQALAQHEQRERELALRDAKEHRLERERTERNLYKHLLATAEREWLLGDAPRARRFLDQCPEPLRRWEWMHLRRRFEGGTATFNVPGSGLSTLVGSSAPDGMLITGGIDGIVRFWDGMREVAALTSESGPVMALAVSSTASCLAVGDSAGVVRLYDLGSHRKLRTLTAQNVSAVALAFSPDGRRIAVGARDPKSDTQPQELRVFDVQSGSLLFVCKGHEGTIFAVAFSPDGQRIATGGGDGTVRLWDAEGKSLAVLDGHEGLVTTVVFSPDGSRFASAGFDHKVRIWDAANRHLLKTLIGHVQPVLTLAFAPNGNRLASGSWDRTVRVWDATTGTATAVYQGHLDSLQAVVYSPDGTNLFSAARSGEIKRWEPNGSPEYISLAGAGDWVPAAVFSSDGSRMASVLRGNQIALWKVREAPPRTGAQPERSWSAHRYDIRALVFTPENSIVSCASDGTLKHWNGQDGRLLRGWRAHRRRATALAVSSQSLLASGGSEGEISLWRLDGTLVRSLTGHSKEITGLAFSPDGSRLVSGSEDGTARIYNVETAEEVTVFHGHGSKVQSVAFAPDGAWVASASGDRDRSMAPCDVRLWDARTGQELLRMSDDSVVFWCLCISPDGTRIVTGNDSGMVKLWDATDGTELLTLVGHRRDDLRYVTFSPNGRYLASSGDDEQVILWDATPVTPSSPR